MADGTGGTRVELQNVSKRFGPGVEVLAPLSLTAEPGDFVGLAGPSGCGKTTLLRLLAGLTAPSAGSLAIDGLAPAAARGRLAYIFQDATLLPWLNARRNVELPLRLRGEAAEARSESARKLLRLVGLADAENKYPRQLSGGMKMRVSIARALTLRPGLLLMDEPFAALDEITRNRLNEDLLRLREGERFTAFFVTHSVAEAVFLSRRVVVFSPSPGRIFEEIAVPFDYPRTAALRESLDYQKLVARTAAVLRTASSVASFAA